MPSKRRIKDETDEDRQIIAPLENDRPPPTSTPSFKGQLAKYNYSATTALAKTAHPAQAATLRSSKRLRITMEPAHSPATPGSSPKSKKRKPSSRYADPSKYAHLSPLTDILAPNLICIFVGTNPGVRTATAGHAYAHPSNSFWKLLHSSGLTDRRLKPEEDVTLPAKFCMGNTNIVSRPSKDAAELSKEEMVEGAKVLEEKMRKWKPESVCIVGKGIWEAIWRARVGRAMRKGEFKYGWQEEEWNMGMCEEGEEELGPDGERWRGSRVFVATSTSGLAASLKMEEKEEIWRPFGEFVQKRREQRGFVPEEVDGEAGD